MTKGSFQVIDVNDVPALRFVEEVLPPLEQGYARIRMKAMALNHLDLWTTNGIEGVKINLPIIVGSDGSGVIESIKPKSSTAFKEGNSVMLAPGLSCGGCPMCISGHDQLCRFYKVLGHTSNGTATTVMDIPCENLLPIPQNWNYEQAAAFPLVFLTAWEMLVEKTKLSVGETVLIWGGGSGVGTAAIQLVKLIGGQSIVIVGDDEKAIKTWDLGATHVINRNRENILEKVKTITGQAGVDVVFEHPGPASFGDSMALCKKGGKIVTCGSTTGPTTSLHLRTLFAKQITIFGSYMGRRSNFSKLLNLLEGKSTNPPFKPVIDKIFDFKDYPEAQAYLNRNQHFGKVVCKM